MEQPKNARARVACLILAATLGAAAGPSLADNPAPYPGTVTVTTKIGFDSLLGRLERAVVDNGMGVVARASASKGAAARGVKIPGNAVIMVFRNDYAVRMLAASVPAGIEAPLRIYVTENPDGTTGLTYRKPSSVFAPYGNPKLDEIARELDPVLEKIVQDAAGS